MGTRYLWDPVEDNIVKEFDDAGATVAIYTTEPYLYGDVISQRRGAQSSFYHYDGQGSTTSLTDSAGTISNNYAYTAFGETTEQAGSTANPFEYLGQKGYYRLGLIFEWIVRQRALSASVGRWLSPDPVKAWSYYTYARNSPVIFRDPSGLLDYSIGVLFAADSKACRNQHTEVKLTARRRPIVGKHLLVFQRLQVWCAKLSCREDCRPCFVDDDSEQRQNAPVVDIYEYLGYSPITDSHEWGDSNSPVGKQSASCAERGASKIYRESEIRVFEERVTVNGVDYDIAQEVGRLRGPWGRTVDTPDCFGTKLWSRYRGYSTSRGPRPWWNSYVAAHWYAYTVLDDCCSSPPAQRLLDIDIRYNTGVRG